MKLPFFKKRRMPEKIFEAPAIEARDIIAPSSIAISPNYLKVGERFVKSFFIFSYPRYLSTIWFSPVINLDTPMDIGLHIQPIESGTVLKQLRKSVTEVQAEIMEMEEKGLIRDPALEIAYRDLEELRDRLMTAQERMFKFGLYLTIYGNTEKELRDIETTLRSILESRLIYIKPALYQQKEGFNSCAPYGLDQLQVHTSMNTGPLSSVFPFASFDLSSNEGILYGMNLHNNSLILFDRFSLENANSIVFGKAGCGKSYAIKLEILRSLMLGVDVITIDPENEYRFLSDAVGGSFFNISLASPNHINPFDLPIPREDEKPEDVLKSNIINLVGLLRIMLGGLTPEEDAIIDRALTETYAVKDITPETDPSIWKERIPLMSDLEAVLEGMEGAESLVRRIRKFTKGTFAQFFNQPTNISMEKPFVVFGIRDMEDELRPMAMFIIMRYIWNKVRSELKKRILVVDEAWWIMQTEDGASFLFGIAKRARKYWLGVTTVTQDVNDFMKSAYGQPIITNSSLQILMKQSSATIDVAQKTFNLTEEEKYLLLEAEVGVGIFFAGQKHVAMKSVASYAEDQIITTAPEEVLKIKRAKGEL
ncbi:MAG: conjugal transfer protein TraC [Candidatus Nealsonbacteria bacterium CG10_big_fil_rev_8_21_14_0_10_36_228]|uniref:Conjugal transfer protein TraC n=3 Tax=Candidatus Nealsoniibacteriota TaxID=1817911 RepID=A0A2M8DLF5_9BACT|nr:MAG: conjugal transfer protein TraC [Candidatus Nealsonbacteria bacterium CG23_combo_of_CG06-09_8_20_14_all_36_125]PIR72031.1 MAG: conjugal transfer protein TraC [Candidatus Nealsonbacteria bacterium CG10_big_fil_rev_8_21_14_0_10_36_228]PJB98643.1 MAG: conjugal transfer protein TraC [Candidatus Nealsonbacteria bacterium CG_4_9_14_0_8_um_filter_36_17]